MGEYMDEAFDNLTTELKNKGTINELYVRYGTAARTLDSFREQHELKPPQIPWDDLTMCVALIRQIRNVFAHNTVEPIWDIKPRYRLLYEFDKISISLKEVHGKAFSFDDVNGPESLFALREAFERRI